MDNSTVTLMVNECSEFHGLGESHENIKSVEEAVRLWKHIPPDRMNGIKSIGISVDDGKDITEYDVVVGRHFDFDMIHYYPEILESEKARTMINELRDKLSDLQVMGEVPEQLKAQQEETNIAVPKRGHSR